MMRGVFTVCPGCGNELVPYRNDGLDHLCPACVAKEKAAMLDDGPLYRPCPKCGTMVFCPVGKDRLCPECHREEAQAEKFDTAAEDLLKACSAILQAQDAMHPRVAALASAIYDFVEALREDDE